MSRHTVTILGATGSVGLSTLDVIARNSDRYSVFALSAHRRIVELAQLCLVHRPIYAVVPDDAARQLLLAQLRADSGGAVHAGAVHAGAAAVGTPMATQVLVGEAALAEVASAPEVDYVMAAIVGAAGLRSTMAAAGAGKKILLANKESLVCAGELFMARCREHGARLLPIDSEHNAVFQCLTPIDPANKLPKVPSGVVKIILTASGGPFLNLGLEQMRTVTPEQACAHPNWSMGRKISVDSATMMNKGLELIEAHYLFNLPADALEVLVHPQSIIHSMVEYLDGSVLAQLGNPDMRTPIAQALAFPERINAGVGSLQLAKLGRLDFQAPDYDRFPALALARAALRNGGAAPCVLNAANEINVDYFLNGAIGFTDIADLNARVLDRLGSAAAAHSLDAVLALDQQARGLAREFIKGVTR